MRNNLYVDIHALQVVPPSCINRDDTGSPKTAIYGGVTRARVSSQAWKKAMRDAFKEALKKEDVGIRTKHISSLIANRIVEIAPETSLKDALKLAAKALSIPGKKGIKMDDKSTEDDPKTGALYFISKAQVNAIANAMVNDPSIKKDHLLEIMRAEPTIDIALFGRMVADDPSLNTDACAQVAHSISTHKVNNEYDFFTAIDECSPDDTAGAGMMGTVEYNSSTLYRYATVAVHDLKTKLGDDTANAVKEFVHAFITSMPTGKINTFANRTLPAAVMVTIRTDQPINLVGAFEKPVRSNDEGYLDGSCKAFVKHAKETYENWLEAPAVSFVIGNGLAELGDKVSLNDMLSKLVDELNARL